MNADTIRNIATIKKQGYYPQHQGLGEGGWQAVREFAKKWEVYQLYIAGQIDPVTITARSKVRARKVFHSLYNLVGVKYEIVMKKTEYITVEVGL